MGLSVLVVSQCAGARETVRRALHNARLGVASVHEAEAGRAAIDMIGSVAPDVVFADMRMPMMDGIERIERRCEGGRTATVPVVGLTLDGSTPRIERIMTHNVTAYIRKPCTPEMLRSVVEDVLCLKPALPKAS